MRMRMIMLAVSAFAAFAPMSAHSQGRVEKFAPQDIHWRPCDPDATPPYTCEIGYFRGDPAKQENYSMFRAKQGFVWPPHWHLHDGHLVVTKGTFVIAAEGGQEQDIPVKAGEYLFVPGRRVHWASCPEDCVVYYNVDGPDSYIDVKDRRP